MPDQLLKQTEPRPAAELNYQRPRRTWRARFAADYRHWVRRTFSRESYVSSLKALLWVLPLSALIWSYAFNEELVTTPMMRANITVGQEAGRVVRVAPGEPNRVEVSFKGPQKDVTAVQEYLSRNPIKLDVEHNLPPGRHTIDVLAAINREARVVSASMTVFTCDPRDLVVDVDNLAPRTLEVRAHDLPPGVTATFDTSKIKLMGPSKDLDAANPQFVYADLKPYAGQLAIAGVHKLKAVALEMPAGLTNVPSEFLNFSPSTVSITIDVSGSETTAILPPIPVGTIIMPTMLADSYRVEYEHSLPGVSIAGPKAAIEGIQKNTEISVFAAFKVDSWIAGPHTARLVYEGLPPGVTVTNPGDIKYTLVSRTSNP